MAYRPGVIDAKYPLCPETRDVRDILRKCKKQLEDGLA